MTSINQDKLHELFDYVEGIVTDEKVPAAQIAIGHDGELAGMRTFGVAHQGTSVGPAGDDLRRRAHPRAPGLPGQGHRVVDGRGRRPRRALRRD